MLVVLIGLTACGGSEVAAESKAPRGDSESESESAAAELLEKIQIRPGAVPALIPDQRGSGAQSEATNGQLLPDLDQEAPTELTVSKIQQNGDLLYVLGFDSATANVGAGPLIVDGRRARPGGDTMDATQVVVLEDGNVRSYPNAGALVFVQSPDHDHWHYLPFMRYELRTADGSDLLRWDVKTGFCLGDRYRTALSVDEGARAAEAVFTSRCGLGERELAEIREGISVGFGDDYPAILEGQIVDITNLDPSEYLLVHRVNEKRLLRESHYDNNAASVRLRLTWMNGEPRIDVLAVCPDADTCLAE